MCGYPLALFVCLPYAVQINNNVSSESSSQVWLLSSAVAAFMASSFRICSRTLWVSPHRDRCPDGNFWNQCLVVRQLTALSPKSWRIRRLAAPADNPKRDVSTPQCFLAAARAITDACAQRTCIGNQLLSLHPTAFSVRDAPIYVSAITYSTRRKNGKEIFGYLIL